MIINSLKDFFVQNQADTLAESDNICAYFHQKKIGKNDFLLEEGHLSDSYFLLASGYMRSYIYDLNGNSVTTGFYASGHPVFEVASYFLQVPSTEYIRAISDCEGWSISRQDLKHLSINHPAFRDFTQKMLIQGFMALKANSLSLINESAEQRYRTLLNTYPDICRNAQLKHIASYLGITDSSLSRIRKQVVHGVAASF